MFRQKYWRKPAAEKAREAFSHIPFARPMDLANADAIIFGTPTRFGNICAQMQNFLDQTNDLWAQNAFVGKVGSAIYFIFNTTWGARNNPNQFVYYLAPSRDDNRRFTLLGDSPNDNERNHRREPIWYQQHLGLFREQDAE